jgi:hypothetical protein
LGKDVIAPALMKVIPPKKGRGRMVKGSPEAKAYMASIRAKKTGGSKSSGFVQRMVAVDQSGDDEEKEKLEKYRPFDLSAIQDYTTPFLSPSQNLRTTYAKKKKGRPVKHATAEEKYQAKLLSNKLKRQEKALAKKMAKAQKEGGAMIMNHPGEFHSSTYPPALASYKHQMSVGGSFLGDMGKAFKPIAKDVIVPVGKELATEFIRNKMRGGKKSSFLGDMGKAFAPIAKDVIVPVGKELATEFIRNKMRGGKKSALSSVFKAVAPVAKVVGKEIVVPLAKEAIKNKMRGGARSARNEIVKKVMAEMGLSLPMASKYVKEQGLY